jgi:8-oxo-dGTP pyrophosphatase MutT (NUDIX family)
MEKILHTENLWKEEFRGNLIMIERHGGKGFERAVRPPGVRLILTNENGDILLTKEFRSEQGKDDFRLPGGKVFDDLSSYLEVRDNSEALNDAVMQAGKLEAKQEAGVDHINDLTLHSKSVAGASVEWDLYYLTGSIGKMGEQDLEEDEKERGIDVGFYTKEKVLEMLKSGEISEDRSSSVLFRYVLD